MRQTAACGGHTLEAGLSNYTHVFRLYTNCRGACSTTNTKLVKLSGTAAVWHGGLESNSLLSIHCSLICRAVGFVVITIHMVQESGIDDDVVVMTDDDDDLMDDDAVVLPDARTTSVSQVANFYNLVWLQIQELLDKSTGAALAVYTPYASLSHICHRP